MEGRGRTGGIGSMVNKRDMRRKGVTSRQVPLGLVLRLCCKLDDGERE